MAQLLRAESESCPQVFPTNPPPSPAPLSPPPFPPAPRGASGWARSPTPPGQKSRKGGAGRRRPGVKHGARGARETLAGRARGAREAGHGARGRGGDAAQGWDLIISLRRLQPISAEIPYLCGDYISVRRLHICAEITYLCGDYSGAGMRRREGPGGRHRGPGAPPAGARPLARGAVTSPSNRDSGCQQISLHGFWLAATSPLTRDSGRRGAVRG